MLDTMDPISAQIISDTMKTSLTPYNELLVLYDSITLQRQRFSDTTEGYLRIVEEFESGDHDDAVCFSLAVRIIIHLCQFSYQIRRRDYMLFDNFFKKAMTCVNGYPRVFLKKIEAVNGILEPVQAPKGWSCPICLGATDSHLCDKTPCGHYFHLACMVKYEAPTCPMCRQDI